MRKSIRSKNAGVDNLLKMKEMFDRDAFMRTSVEIDFVTETFLLDVHPFNGQYAERSIITYRFNSDGTYKSQPHA